ncbi:transmembrane 6 superfamily member 2 [Sylvia atricapilla]|uniref:transmembrane 6 superfamily member 2 n=1 Tax=Sylvia atricapilla TaxID=48155 RepID=UPI003397C729
MQLPAAAAALAAPVLAVPAALGVSAATGLPPTTLALTVTLVLLGFISFLILTGSFSLFQDPLYCVFVAFSFASAVDLLVALEEDGLIAGVTELFVREGDAHLRTAHGLLTCYWDGSVHYGLCLALAAAAGTRKNYRGLGLLWLGSMAMSALVFLLGNLIGKYSPELSPSFLLNLPYLLLLTWAGRRLLQQPRAVPQLSPEQIAEEQSKPLYRRPEDVLLILLLLLTAAFTFFRGLVVLDCPADLCFDYTYLREPYLRDPVGYPKVQMLVYLFYLLPFLLLAVRGLALPGCCWLPDCSLLCAGAVAQAQFAHVGSSLHGRTPFPYQTPEEALGGFLVSNALLALSPALVALRCRLRPAFFLPRARPGLPRHKKDQ